MTARSSAKTRLCSVVTWTELAMWWMKKTSTATSQMARITAKDTAMTGTNAGVESCSVRTARSTTRVYRNVEVSTARTSWFPRSAMKLRTSRGPYAVEVVASTEMVIEKDVAATPSIVPPMTVRMARPPVADKSAISGRETMPWLTSSRSPSVSPSASTTAPIP